MNKKDQVLTEIFKICQKRNNYVFHNDLVKDISKIEFQGAIGVFEGKNGKADSFAVYQIYHPFLYYYKAS